MENAWAVYIAPIVILGFLASPLRNRYPLVITGTVAVIGWMVLAWSTGLASAAVSAGVGLLVLLVLGLLGITSRTTTLAVAVPLVCLPPQAWIFGGAALLITAAVAALSARRRLGKGYLAMATGETLAAFGVEGSEITRPNLNRLPVEASSSETSRGRTSGTRVRLPLFLLAANVVGLAWAVYTRLG